MRRLQTSIKWPNKERRELAKQAAKIDNRSLNSHLLHLVEQDLKEKNLLEDS